MKAKDLDKKFDAGEDISRYVEIDKARKPLRQAGNVQVELCTDELSKVTPARDVPRTCTKVRRPSRTSNELKEPRTDKSNMVSSE